MSKFGVLSIFNIWKIVFSIFKVRSCSDGIQYASYATRYFSIIFDLICLVAVLQSFAKGFYWLLQDFMATAEVMEKYRFGMDLSGNERSQMRAHMISFYGIQVLEAAVLYAYHLLFWTKLGGTPAKLILGVRIVDMQSRRFLTKMGATKRFLGYVVSILPLGLGIIWGAFDKKSQMLHDKLSGSIVVTRNSMRPTCAEDAFENFLGQCRDCSALAARAIARTCLAVAGRMCNKKP